MVAAVQGCRQCGGWGSGRQVGVQVVEGGAVNGPNNVHQLAESTRPLMRHPHAY